MKWMHFYKFSTQLSLCFAFTIIFMASVMMILLHGILGESYRSQAQLVIQTQASQLATNADNRMQYFQSYSSMLCSDEDLSHIMQTGTPADAETLLRKKSSEFLRLNSGRVRGIYLYCDGKYIGSTPTDDDDQNKINDFKKSSAIYGQNAFWTATHLNHRNEKVFSVLQKVHQSLPLHDYIIELCLYESEIHSFFNKDENGNLIAIFNRGDIMSLSDRELLHSLLWASRTQKAQPVALQIENKQIVFSSNCSQLNWQVCIQTNPAYLEQGFSQMFARLLPLMLGILMIVLIFSRAVALQFNRRLSLLQVRIAKLSEGILSEQLCLQGNDEFKTLADELDNTRLKLLLLIKQIEDANSLKRTAEICALRAQINSHFLFNTLSSIKYLAQQNRWEVLCEAVDHLAHFLRYSLSLEENTVPLSSELDQLKNYIYLQKLRYGDDVNVYLDVDDSLLNCRTVKLILQPLVENAIFHGRREDGSALNIGIYTNFDDIDFWIYVEDDGNGIPDPIIHAVLDGERYVSSVGYGLRNVVARIRACTEINSSINIESEVGIYTRIAIRQNRAIKLEPQSPKLPTS